MAELPKVSQEAFIESMRPEVERALAEVMQAVNDAPEGAWINASEWQVHEVMGELRRVAYQKALQMRTEAGEGAFSPPEQAQNKGLEERSSLTVPGWVRIRRRRWSKRPGASGHVADEWLDAALAGISLGSRELCCLLNANSCSFERSALMLKKAGGISLSSEKLRQVVETEGKRVLTGQESGVLSPGWQAADCKAATPAGAVVSRVYLGADGFMVPLLSEAEKLKRRQQVVQGRRRRGKSKPKLPALPASRKGADQRYKEFKAVLLFDQDLEHRLVSVTRKDHNEAGRIMRRDAGRIGLQQADERVGLIDGGPWIINQIRLQSLPMTAVGLDFYHLSQNLHQSRRLTFGDDNSDGQAWADQLLHQARHEGYEPLWRELIQWRGRWRNAGKRKEADRLLHYVSDRREMIQYPLFASQGWRIGSGPVESQCRIVPDRVKGPGKRWDADNAEAVMALETLQQSNQWQSYWTTAAARLT